MGRQFQNVALGENSAVDETAFVGLPPRGAADGELPTVIGCPRYRDCVGGAKVVCWPGFFERPYIWREQT